MKELEEDCRVRGMLDLCVGACGSRCEHPQRRLSCERYVEVDSAEGESFAKTVEALS